MKHMSILLSATVLATIPCVSSAKDVPTNPLNDALTVEACTCKAPVYDETYLGMRYECSVTWNDVIATSENPATYGASFDVKLLDETTGDEEILFAELEYDWGDPEGVCNGTSCTVVDAPFVLTNYTGETVEVEAAVKAFENGSKGTKPRNFKKSRSLCTVGESTPVAL